MVNSGSFDSDGQGDRNAKVGFTQPHNVSDSTQSSSPVTASVAAPCKTDFSQTADSDLPSVAHAIEPTPTKTEFNSDMPVENFTSLSSLDGALEESEKSPVSVQKKTSLCCSVPLDKVQGVLSPYHPPATKTDDDGTKAKQPTRKLLCLYCDRSFVSSNLRQKHVERIHSVKQNRRVSSRRQNQLTVTPCVYCDRLTGTENTLKDLFQHLINEHSSKYFGCLPCEDRFLTSSLLADHNATNHQSTVLQPTQHAHPPPGAYKTTLIPQEIDYFKEEEPLEDIPVKITRSRMKPKPEREPDKGKKPGISNKKKTTKLKEFRSKKLSVKSSRIALKRRESKRLQALAKLADSQKKKRPRPTEKKQSLSKTEHTNSTKSTEKVKTNSTCINPYPEFDHFYRVKKITDHSIDNLKISSLTFDDVFDKAFFNRIKCNIEENLLLHIDGKLFKNEESESRISNFEKVSTVPQEIQNSTSENYGCELSLNAVTPVASLSLNSQFGEDFESQIEYGSKPSKKKTQPRKDEIHYKYFTRRKYQASILEHKENRDLSKLDMWTQLVIKKRQQKMLDDKKSAKEILEYTACDEYKNKQCREELNRILDRRGPFEDLKEEASKKAALDKLNSVCEDSISEESFTEVREVLNEILNRVFAVTEDVNTAVEVAEAKSATSNGRKYDQREIPAFLNLRRSSSLPSEGEIDKSDKITLICSSQETENFELPTNQVRGKNELIELTGEWARCRMYICAACGAKLPNMKYLLEHKSLYHQNVWVQHYEFVGNQSELYRHLSIPALGKVGAVEGSVQCKLWKRSDARVCTKCGKQCNSLGELHRHILECGGDWTWMLARKKCKYRPFGAKSRRKRRGLIHRIHLKQKTEPTEKKTYKKSFDGPRPKPSDADTIQRMLANLPAKRSTRKLISLQDGIYRSRKKTQINSINQKKVKCGKVIYKSSTRKETTEKTINTTSRLNGKGQKNNSSVNRRSLRSLNKVLASRILDTNTKLSVKRKIKALNEKRRTRQSQIELEEVTETLSEELVEESSTTSLVRVKSKARNDDDTDEEEGEPAPKRCSPRSMPKTVKKKMSMKSILTGKISIKSFFPVKKKKNRKPLQENQNPQDEKLGLESTDLKTRSKRKSKEVIEVEEKKKEVTAEKVESKKTRNETFSSLVRSFSIHKKKARTRVEQQAGEVKKQIPSNTKETVKIQDVTVEKDSDADKSSKKRKLKRSFRNVINRVKKLKIENTPESGVEELETKANKKGGAFLEESNLGGCPTPVQAEKIVIPSISEAKENIADISIPVPIVMNFQGPNENPPIPETIFKLDSNNEKNLQAKCELDFDTPPLKTYTSDNTEHLNTETSLENTAIDINPKTQPISIETSIKPKIVPLISPNMKGKIRKPARGLNDCIAMLTIKLQQKTTEEHTAITVEEKPTKSHSMCNLLAPNIIPEAHKELPQSKTECILRIPTFKSQKIYPQGEETALDLSTKSLSSPDLSRSSGTDTFNQENPRENREEALRIQRILTSMEMLNKEKLVRQINRTYNSVDRIIEDVVDNNIHTVLCVPKGQGTWNSVDDTIQGVIDNQDPTIPKLRDTIDDIIDFVVDCGNLKDISCKINESKTVTEENFVNKSKEKPTRKIGSIRKPKSKISLSAAAKTEEVIDNSYPEIVVTVPKEPNEDCPTIKVTQKSSEVQHSNYKLTLETSSDTILCAAGSLKKKRSPKKCINTENAEVNSKDAVDVSSASTILNKDSKYPEEITAECANNDLNVAFINSTESVVGKNPVKGNMGGRKVGQIRSKSRTKKVPQTENKTSGKLLLETNLDNLLHVNEISSQPEMNASSILQPTIFADKESTMTKDEELKKLCNEDEPYLLENKVVTTQQNGSVLPSDSEDDIPLAALLSPDEPLNKAGKYQPDESVSDEEIPLIEIIKTKATNSGQAAPKTAAESILTIANETVTVEKGTKRSNSPQKKVENLQNELTTKDNGDADQILEFEKHIGMTSGKSSTEEHVSGSTEGITSQEIAEKSPTEAVQKLEDKTVQLDVEDDVFVEPIVTKKTVKRRSRSLKTKISPYKSLDEDVTDENFATSIACDSEESLFETNHINRRSRSVKETIENMPNDYLGEDDVIASDFLNDSFTERDSSCLVQSLEIKRPRGRPKKAKVLDENSVESSAPSLTDPFVRGTSIDGLINNKIEVDMVIRPRGRPRKSKDLEETVLRSSISSNESTTSEIGIETCDNKMETDLLIQPKGKAKRSKEFDETSMESSTSSLCDSFAKEMSGRSPDKKMESELTRPRGRPRKIKEFEDTILGSNLSALSKKISMEGVDKKIESNLLTRPRGRSRKTSSVSSTTSLRNSFNKEINDQLSEISFEELDSKASPAVAEPDPLLTESLVNNEVHENSAEKTNVSLGFLESDWASAKKLKKNVKKQTEKSLNVIIAPSHFHPALTKHIILPEDSAKEAGNVLAQPQMELFANKIGLKPLKTSSKHVTDLKDLNSSNITFTEEKEIISEDLLKYSVQNLLPTMSEVISTKKTAKKLKVERLKTDVKQHLLEDLKQDITVTEVVSGKIDSTFKNPVGKIKKGNSKTLKSKLAITKRDIIAERKLQMTDSEVCQRDTRNLFNIIEKTLSNIAVLDPQCKKVNRQSLNTSDGSLINTTETDIIDIPNRVTDLSEENILDTAVGKGRKKLQTKHPKNNTDHNGLLSKMEETMENMNVLTEASAINDNKSDNQISVSKASLTERNNSKFDLVKSKLKQRRPVKNRRKIKSKRTKIILSPNDLNKTLVENQTSNDNLCDPILAIDESVSKDKELEQLQSLQAVLNSNSVIEPNNYQEPPIKIVINKQKTRRKSKSFKKVDLKGQNDLFQDFSLVIKKSKRIAPIITYTPVDTFSNAIYPNFIKTHQTFEQPTHTEPVPEDITEEIAEDLDASVEEMDMELDEIPIVTSIIERDSSGFTNTLPAPFVPAEGNACEIEKQNIETDLAQNKAAADNAAEELFQPPEKDLPPPTEEEVFLYEANKRSSRNKSNADILSSVQEVEISNRKCMVKSQNKVSLDNSYEISEDINNFDLISQQKNSKVYQSNIELGSPLLESEKSDKTTESIPNDFDRASGIDKEGIQTGILKETGTLTKKCKKSKLVNKSIEDANIVDILSGVVKEGEKEVTLSNKNCKAKISKNKLEEAILFNLTATISKLEEKATDMLADTLISKEKSQKFGNKNLEIYALDMPSSIAEANAETLKTRSDDTETLVKTTAVKHMTDISTLNSKDFMETHDVSRDIVSVDPPINENKNKRGRKKKCKPSIPKLQSVDASIDNNSLLVVLDDSFLDKGKDIDSIYAFTELDDLEMEKPVEKPQRLSRKQTMSFSEAADKFVDHSLNKNDIDFCNIDINSLHDEMRPNTDSIVAEGVSTPFTKKCSRSGKDLSTSILEGKDGNPGEIKENGIGIDIQDNGRRKSVRSAKVKALEHIHDDALAELTESKRNRELDKGKIVVLDENITQADNLTMKRSSRRSSKARRVSTFVEPSEFPKENEKSELSAILIDDLQEFDVDILDNDEPEENVDAVNGSGKKYDSKKIRKNSKILDNIDLSIVSKDSIEIALEELNNIAGLEELENSIEKELNAIDCKKKTKHTKNKSVKEIEVSKDILQESNLEGNIQHNLTAEENNQELRRSRRGSRKVASYNEIDIIDPLLDEIDGKRKTRRKEKTEAVEPVAILSESRQQINANDAERKLNSDELFDLLKASSNEHTYIPKPQNSLLNLEESSLKEFNDDNFENVFEDILEKSSFLIQNSLLDKGKQKDIDKIYEFTENPDSNEPILPLDSSKKANKKLPKRNLSPSKPPIEETSQSISIAPDSTFSIPTTPDISELSRDSKTKTTKSDKSTPSDKPIYCEICNKSFIRVENLIKHKRTLTHIQKLSELEAREAAEKSKPEQCDSKTSDSIIEISPESTKTMSDMSKNDINISDILQDSNKPPGQHSPLIHSSFPNNHSLKLADIINDVLNKPVLEGANEKHNSFSDIIMHKPDVQPEYRRYKSLGERKSFESEPVEPQQITLETSYVSKTTILEKQISLLEDIIENQAGVNYIDDISISSNNSLENTGLENNLERCSPSELSLKQDDSSNIPYGGNNSLKPNTNDDSFLKPSQYEEISDDSINLRNYEDQKLRKTLNRDEELFLECCSLLKSGSEVSSYSNKKSHNKVLGTMGLKQCDEPEWLERKSLVQKPLYDAGNEYSDDNSRIPTPLGDSYDDDASNSNTITSNWNINRQVPVYEAVTPDKQDSGNNSFSFEEVLNDYDERQKKEKVKGGISKFGCILTKTVSKQVKALPRIISRKDLVIEISEDDAFEKKQGELSDESASDSKKMITKGARKVFEGLKVSIPTEELNLEKVLNCSPKSKKIDMVNIQSTADNAKQFEELPSPERPARTARKSKPVKNKSQFGSNLLFKMNKKKVLSPTSAKKNDDDVKTHDVYDFEETQDNTDVFTKPDFRTFRNMKCNEPLLEPESDTESRDYIEPFCIEAQSITSSISSSSSKRPKSQENITKKKCMIMGRIFKNAAKSKIEDIDEEIREIPELDNSELVENYVAECTKVIRNEEVAKPKLSEREINQIFDQLLENKLETQEVVTDPKPTVKKPDIKKKVKPKNRKRARANSDSTDDEFNLNKTIKKRAYRKNGKAEDNCINLEQELKECIGVASRKSQRKCTSGKQNILMEYWSSDDSQFEALLESQKIEVKQVIEPINVSHDITECENTIPHIPEGLPKEVEPAVEEPQSALPESSEKQHKPKNPDKRPQQKRKLSSDKKPKPTNASNSKTIDTVSSNRRKRAAANPLYHWSSSSEDESQDLIEVKPIRDEVEDDEDRPVQHGWIVGDSPKKLVTMLAQAKGKKTDIDCVKEQGKKRTNAVS